MSEKEGTKNSMANYEVIISVKKEKYCCRIPELYLVAKGNDLESSYQELMKKKSALIKEIEEFESADEYSPPLVTRFRDSKGSRSSSAGNDLRGFLIKTGVVSLLVLIVLFIASQIISGETEKLVNNVRTGIKNSIPSKLGRKIENALYRAVDHPINPEREQKIATSIRVIVNRLKPFAREFRPLLEEVGLAKNTD